jgi:three-Cys-motif partner protein
MCAVKYDEIGYWSEIKLEIVKQYASAYSTIMANQRFIKGHAYIDAFAGPGVHISKQTGEFVPGSPTNALLVRPPFTQFYFIDLDGDKADELRKLAGDRKDVQVFGGDCNRILEADVFPHCRFKDFRRALCLLDPYGLHLNWSVLAAAGQMKSVEIFLNFPVMDMNRNVLWLDPDKVQPEQMDRMDAFWGDHSWRDAAYRTDQDLFGFPKKTDNETIAKAFQTRLIEGAGFKYVPDPMPMRNTKGAIVYYLFFASPNKTGRKIVEYIFGKYRERGVS